jgi:hypothetical protein
MEKPHIIISSPLIMIDNIKEMILQEMNFRILGILEIWIWDALKDVICFSDSPITDLN